MTTHKDHSVPDAHTFGTALGQATFLMTMSKEHRELPVKDIEQILTTPILLQQFKLYSKEKQPIAFVSWATVTDEIKASFRGR